MISFELSVINLKFYGESSGLDTFFWSNSLYISFNYSFVGEIEHALV